MRIVVLGATGRLGNLIRKVWPGDVDTVWQSRRPGPGLTVKDVDDADGMRRLLAGADAIVCLLGVPHARDGDMQDNLRLAQLTLDAARSAGAGHVLLASSAAVYDATIGPLTENAATDPASDYGRAKRDMERMANDHSHPCTCLRIGNVAGADSILGGWRTGFRLDTFADGTTPLRSYIGPVSLAQSLFRLCKTHKLPDILNLAAPGAIAKGDLLDAAGLAWQPRPATDQTRRAVILDLSRLARLIPLEPATPESLVAEWQSARTLS